MKYYKVFYWIKGIFGFEIVEVPYTENSENAIFTVREYHRSKGTLQNLRISHASLYFAD